MQLSRLAEALERRRCACTPELFSVRMPKPEVEDFEAQLDARRGSSSALEAADPHVVATLLQQQLRGLGCTTGLRARTLAERPAWALLPFARVDAYRRDNDSSDDAAPPCAAVARGIAAAAPPQQHAVLRLIIELCRALLKEKRSSGVSRGKLAKIFAPLLCPPSAGDEYLCVRHRAVLPCAAQLIEALFDEVPFPPLDAALGAQFASAATVSRVPTRRTSLAILPPAVRTTLLLPGGAVGSDDVGEREQRLTSSMPSPAELSLAEEVALLSAERCTWPDAWVFGNAKSPTMMREGSTERSSALLARVGALVAVLRPSAIAVATSGSTTTPGSSPAARSRSRSPRAPLSPTDSSSKVASPSPGGGGGAAKPQKRPRPSSREQRRRAVKEAQAQLTRLCAMAPQQLEAEKARIKRELKAWDTQWAAAHGGREPDKKAKEAVRPWYTVYNELKFMLSSLGKMPASDGSSPASTTTVDAAVLALERRVLQRRISRFEKEFEEQHGRKVKFQRDVGGVQWQYARYKVRIVLSRQCMSLATTAPPSTLPHFTTQHHPLAHNSLTSPDFLNISVL